MPLHIKNLFYTLLLLLLCLTFPISSNASDANDWKTVRISAGINKSLYLNDVGEPEGYCSEYLIQLAKINHWNLEYVEASWSNSLKNLKEGNIDILFPTQQTKERETIMGFSNSIGGYQPIGLFADSKSDFCYDDYQNFDGTRIAVSSGTSNETALAKYAEEHNFSYTPVFLDTTKEKQDALSNGSVDLIVFSTLNDVPNGKVVALLDYLPFYYCTRVQDTDLLAELNYGMNQMLLRNPVLVQDVFSNFMSRNISFAYTADEKAAIDKKGNIIVGIYENTPPLFSRSESGDYKGIYVDLIGKIEDLSGLDITIRELGRGEDAFTYLDDGTLDFVLGSTDQSLKYTGKKDYVQSDGIMDYYTIAITNSNYVPSTDKPMVFALTAGRGFWAPLITEHCPNASFQYFETSKDCLDAVQRKKADITLLNTWEYNYQSKNDRFQTLIEWETSRTLSETVFVSRSTENEEIRSVLDKSIDQIANAEKEGIITANLNGVYEDYNFADKLYSVKETLIIFGCVLLIVIVGFSVYIIMRRRNINVLKESNLQLANANQAKDRFLSRMSHELRTPLNAINGYTTILEQNLNEPPSNKSESKQNLDSIHHAVQYQLSIIDNLLDIQKIGSGKLELKKVEVDLTRYMNTIVEMIKPEADKKNLTFTYEQLSRFRGTYLLDAVRFQQVLLNLLHNAIKFTPENGFVKLTVDLLKQELDVNTLEFTVSDNGIGISEDFQANHLFKSFAQEHGGTTSPYEGCGTGLAISKEIMLLMGGDITCESKEGTGSTFTVLLPAEHVAAKKPARKRIDYSKYDLSGIHILLCEDNPMNQDMERRLLQKMNCCVDIADDGAIGLEKFSQSSVGYYDVILMDIRMPNMDGWECTKYIRALDRTDAKSVIILAVSANAFNEDIQQSLDSGMNEHLSKPIDVRIMYEKISKYCK